MISITVTSPPGAITLQVSPNKQKGRHTPVLSWSGANGTNVDIYRDGGQIITTTNDGSHTDATGNKGGRTYLYQVCEAGSSICSAEVTVVY
jgi:serine protease